MFRTALALLLFAVPAYADAKFQKQVMDPYVQVSTSTGTGAGVAIEVNGEPLILTAAHVAELAKRPDGTYAPLTLSKWDDEDGMATVWKADVIKCGEKSKEGDLALLRPRTPLGLTPAKLCGSIAALERGEDCWYVGTAHDIHGGLEKSVINRPVFRVDDEWVKDHKFTVVNGVGWYGNSGGPLYVKRGSDYYVVGILVRLAAGDDPKSPICCETLGSIVKFTEGLPTDPFPAKLFRFFFAR